MKDHEKVNIIKQLNLDYYFDDKPEILDTLSGQAVKVFMKDQSYNRLASHPRITNWAEWKEYQKDS
jgi:uncharacterized HAD superfamily protein